MVSKNPGFGIFSVILYYENPQSSIRVALIWGWGIAEVLTAILMHKQGAWSSSTLLFL